MPRSRGRSPRAPTAISRRSPGSEPAAGGTPFDPVEQRAAATCVELCAELAEIGELPGCEPPDLAELAEAIESATVSLWRGSAEGRVRILDPYRIRAGRARHLFCAGLQEGEFPRRSAGDPLLGDDRRAKLGLEALKRRDPLDEERYLFHACVSRPTERLYLSWQSADDDGARPRARRSSTRCSTCSGPTPGRPSEQLTRRRGLERVTFAPDQAPTAARAARAPRRSPGRGSRSASRGRSRVPAVLDALARARACSARARSSSWLECPYRWFVEHELRPQRLDPRSDALRLGSIAHDALERALRRPARRRRDPAARRRRRAGRHGSAS